MKFTYHKNGLLDLRSLPKAGKIKTAIGRETFESIHSDLADELEINTRYKAMSLKGYRCWAANDIDIQPIGFLMEVLCTHCRYRLVFLAGGSGPCAGLNFKEEREDSE